jgi:hypothetical protein
MEGSTVSNVVGLPADAATGEPGLYLVGDYLGGQNREVRPAEGQTFAPFTAFEARLLVEDRVVQVSYGSEEEFIAVAGEHAKRGERLCLPVYTSRAKGARVYLKGVRRADGGT